MTPEQKIKHTILVEHGTDLSSKYPEITEENIDSIFEDFEDELQDDIYLFREGDVETDIPCDWSRHYESKSVASKMVDGSWVGWTYWYGGGKHGEPESIPWMNEAYDLDLKEEEKLVVIQTFTRKT